MTDYYSIGHASAAEAQAAIAQLSAYPGEIAINGPFQIVLFTDDGDPNAEPDPIPPTIACDGLWYFNARGEDAALPGPWADPQPATPFRVWA